jgi:hypothetical protein
MRHDFRPFCLVYPEGVGSVGCAAGVLLKDGRTVEIVSAYVPAQNNVPYSQVEVSEFVNLCMHTAQADST